MSKLDSIIRVLLALAVATLYLIGKIDGTLAIVMMSAAVIILLTSFVNFCPIYKMFGIKTLKGD
ncbi:DUF2892 domain-containing protein [Candidatus Kapabacteria bacterium]|nr:DUF2892 domain-containing protein [Candidatus Kapabacteria bacterium]